MDIEEEAEKILGEVDASELMDAGVAPSESIEFLETILFGIESRLEPLRRAEQARG